MWYKLQTGSFAWVVHRVTGIVLTLYIFLHLYVLSHLKDPAGYAAMMELLRTPLLRISEAGLLGIVAAHALNGLRLAFLEAGAPTRLHKPFFWSAFAAGAGVFLYGGWIIIRGHP